MEKVLSVRKKSLVSIQNGTDNILSIRVQLRTFKADIFKIRRTGTEASLIALLVPNLWETFLMCSKIWSAHVMSV